MMNIKTIGIPKEIKNNESRVSLIPNDIQKLNSLNIKIIIESGAGKNAGYSDDDYIKCGAIILKSAIDIYNNSDIIVKVKEPQISEYDMIKDGQRKFTFFHFASNLTLLDAMMKAKATCIAYEMIQLDNGIYPILAPMSKIAGEEAMKYAYKYTKGNKNDIITIIGLGNVGKASAIMARMLGYERIILMDIDENKLREFNEINDNYFEIYTHSIDEIMTISTIIIGSVYRFGAKASMIISDRLLSLVPERSIIMDVAIDQGGITSQSIATTIDNPIIKYKNASIYCVPNIPCQVPDKASNELSGIVIEYVKKIVEGCISDDIEGGIFMKNGVIC